MAMSLKDEFRKMITELTARFPIPAIADVFFPAFYRGGQPKDAEFMAICLEGEAAGISYVLLPDEKENEYTALRPVDFVGKDPRRFALEFGNDDPIKEMISLAAINSICQHVMRASSFPVDSATDSVGLLSVSTGDRIGMVGLFFPLVNRIKKVGAELVVLEKKERLIHEYPDLAITLDAAELRMCNKILCTSTTILNNSLDEILSDCSPDALVSIIGPTAGYFPDPLFARGVDILSGRVVKNGARFLQLLAERKRWGDATEKVCFQKETYTSII
jgi:uncharacterized protein (DUF4213/DUF364 family)